MPHEHADAVLLNVMKTSEMDKAELIQKLSISGLRKGKKKHAVEFDKNDFAGNIEWILFDESNDELTRGDLKPDQTVLDFGDPQTVKELEKAGKAFSIHFIASDENDRAEGATSKVRFKWSKKTGITDFEVLPPEPPKVNETSHEESETNGGTAGGGQKPPPTPEPAKPPVIPPTPSQLPKVTLSNLALHEAGDGLMVTSDADTMVLVVLNVVGADKKAAPFKRYRVPGIKKGATMKIPFSSLPDVVTTTDKNMQLAAIPIVDDASMTPLGEATTTPVFHVKDGRTVAGEIPAATPTPTLVRGTGTPPVLPENQRHTPPVIPPGQQVPTPTPTPARPATPTPTAPAAPAAAPAAAATPAAAPAATTTQTQPATPVTTNRRAQRNRSFAWLGFAGAALMTLIVVLMALGVIAYQNRNSANVTQTLATGLATTRSAPLVLTTNDTTLQQALAEETSKRQLAMLDNERLQSRNARLEELNDPNRVRPRSPNDVDTAGNRGVIITGTLNASNSIVVFNVGSNNAGIASEGLPYCGPQSTYVVPPKPTCVPVTPPVSVIQPAPVIEQPVVVQQPVVVTQPQTIPGAIVINPSPRQQGAANYFNCSPLFHDRGRDGLPYLGAGDPAY